MPIEYNGQILRSKNELIGCKVLEIDGAIDSPTYESKSYRTTAKMVIAGLVGCKDFVVVRIGRPKWIDAKQIESMISAAIEASINDIII